MTRVLPIIHMRATDHNAVSQGPAFIQAFSLAPMDHTEALP
jgi:hypothetical protein